MKYVVLTLALCALMITPVKAEELQVKPFVSISHVVGSLDYKEDAEDFYSDKASGNTISAGVLINKVVSFELFYQDNKDKNKSSGTWVDEDGDSFNLNTKISFQTVGIDAKLYIPTVINNMNFLGTAGLGYYKFEGKDTLYYDTLETYYDKSSVKTFGYRFGVGVEYNLTENVAVNAIGRIISFEEKDDSPFDLMREMSIGLKLSF